jgi:putative restriction endonuclease
LLLAVHLDALFDAGLMAFSDDGAVLLSPDLNAETRNTFGLSQAVRLRGFSPGHLPYLQYHRRHIAHLDTCD